jgi:hypothetical protein
VESLKSQKKRPEIASSDASLRSLSDLQKPLKLG